MSNKLRLSVLGLVIIAAAVLAGCGETSTSVLYSTPNWLPDGRIICNKLVIKTSQQIYGGGISESRSYVAAFYPTGTGEVELFEGGMGYEITCSPTGEKIAGIAYSMYNNVYRPIMISDYRGNVAAVPNTSNVQYLDWSPDATKLVYSDTSRDLYVINRDGTGKLKIATSAEAVAWRVGEKITYEHVVGTSSSRIYLIGNDVSDPINLIQGVMPQNANDQRVVCRSGGVPKSISYSGTNETTLFSDYSRDTLKLSFDNSKIVGGKSGDSGIWLMNIDGTGYVKIR